MVTLTDESSAKPREAHRGAKKCEPARHYYLITCDRHAPAPAAVGPGPASCRPPPGVRELVIFHPPAEAQGSRPAQPTGVEVVGGEGAVWLFWNAMEGVTDWQYQYKLAGGSYIDWVTEPGGGSTTAFVDGLTNGTEYTFQVRARNDSGAGDPSNGATATPKAQGAAGAEPMAGEEGATAQTGPNIVVQAADSNVKLCWIPVPVASYWQYQYKKTSDANYGSWTRVPGDGSVDGVGVHPLERHPVLLPGTDGDDGRGR